MKQDTSRLQLIQHAQIEMAELYKKLKSGDIGMREAQGMANVMGKLLHGIKLEIDHYNLISKMPTVLPDYNESVKTITDRISQEDK